MLSIGTIAAKVFGTFNDRKLKTYSRLPDEVNALEAGIEALSDDDLRARTEHFRKQLENEEVDLDELIVPAFATVREAAKRTLGQRHFDVQIIGGKVLHDGKIAEMKTGEGKTLVATLAVYLNALTGRGVHVVTVNDYLASRDAEWMGQIYRFLGLTVGCIKHDMDDEQRKAQYACDVTYGTNNEYGFDYLRDNMKIDTDEMVQREHYFAIVDEVDSILVDEARTPLIISGPLEDMAELYKTIDKFIPQLVAEDFELDEKQKQVSLTEAGNEHIENLLQDAGMLKGDSLYDIDNVTVVHHVNQALKAHKLFQRDRDYIVKAGQVVIIDEFTGRMMEGRRFSEGLHQAIEAKEEVDVLPENQTLASITFQNYFRLYEKLAGMTGTAATEAAEFMDIYGLDVIEIPTNVKVERIDEDDEVYRTVPEKSRAIVTQIAECQMRGQPILVGTTSIERSEQLSALLKDNKFIRELGAQHIELANSIKEGREEERKAYFLKIGEYLEARARGAKKGQPPIAHQVLNARFHEQEATIIAQAGVPGAVTIATNMAGRGTDIQLGGNVDMLLKQWIEDAEQKGKSPSPADIEAETARISAEVETKKQKALEGGGLYVIGTERHESRRIDNQLRGRSGRQGDPGHSKFYLSLEDDLMRIFGSDRMDGMLQKLGLEEGEAITHPWINKALEKAQQKVEARNFDIRKQILKYDDVMNDQRKVIFEQRIDIMADDDVSETIEDMRNQVLDEYVATYIPENAYAEQWDTKGLEDKIRDTFGLDLPIAKWAQEEGIADEEIRERLGKEIEAKAAKRRLDIGGAVLSQQTEALDLLESFHARANGEDLTLSEEEAPAYFNALQINALVEEASEPTPGEVGRLFLRQTEKMVLLQTLDNLWREHLVTLEHLRQVIGFRAYGQRDPLNEYKSESFALFDGMLVQLREQVTGILMHIEMAPNGPMPDDLQQTMPEMHAHHMDPLTGDDELGGAELGAARLGGAAGLADDGHEAPRLQPIQTRRKPSERNPKDPSTWGKVARNERCPCGSGKKYKQCHGRHD